MLHYVVIHKISEKEIIVADPAKGIVKYSPHEFFGTREVGEIISRFNDASKIRQAILGVALTMMIGVFMVLIGRFILYFQSSLLFGITIVPLVL